MTVELAHDIIALKIWEQLPEQDKQLRLINSSLNQRIKDFNRGDGSLLGEKELLAWEAFFPLLHLTELQTQYIERSKIGIQRAREEEQAQRDRELRLTQQKLALERKARKRQRVYLGIFGLLTMISIVAGTYAFFNKQKADKNEAFAIVQKDNADAKREEAEKAAIQLGEQTKILALRVSAELFERAEEAENNYNYKLMLDKAKAIKINIEENRKKIQANTKNEVIIQNFDKALSQEEQRAHKLIRTYEADILNGSAIEYASVMNQVKRFVTLENFDSALVNLNKAKKLSFAKEKEMVKQRQIIENTAFLHYYDKASQYFSNNDSKRGKYIYPFQLYLKSKKYGNETQNQTADTWFKDSLCNKLVRAYQIEGYHQIDTIIQVCKNR